MNNIPCPMCLENPASRKHQCPNISLANKDKLCECCEECTKACEDEFDPEVHEAEVINWYKERGL
jgi:hypothetical protein